jgi:hypothetical protein
MPRAANFAAICRVDMPAVFSSARTAQAAVLARLPQPDSLSLRGG